MNKIAHSLSAALLLGCGLAAHAGENIDGDLIARGKALAVASDCMACHTNTPQQGKPYAGGYGIASPMGTIYATNITPSVKYGMAAIPRPSLPPPCGPVFARMALTSTRRCRTPPTPA